MYLLCYTYLNNIYVLIIHIIALELHSNSPKLIFLFYFVMIIIISNIITYFQEGPHSVIADDEFYDAVESGLEKIEEEQEFRERLKNGKSIPITPPPTSAVVQHRLWKEVRLIL